MSDRDAITEIIEEACDVIRKSANARGRISLSPETATRLERLAGSKPERAAARPAAVAQARRGQSGLQHNAQKMLDECQTLEELEELVRACDWCPLAKTRTNAVFGTGNPHAKLVFVGEAPGNEEDRQGKPFVGRAGQLLTDIIEKGMLLKRSDVYICNVLKCRPPENRNPLPAEIECCEPFLIRQLEIIKPKVICALGAFAAQTLLKTTKTIGQLRGSWHFYHGIPLRATYHPAYLLRNPADKRKTWMDVIEVMKVYNGEEEPKEE